jgi:hypothetical protein
MTRKKPVNPFYLLLVVAGVAFAVTACAYGVTAMRALRSDPAAKGRALEENELTRFMSQHGNTLLVGELLVLGAATVAAISTDGYWSRRAEAVQRTTSENES